MIYTSTSFSSHYSVCRNGALIFSSGKKILIFSVFNLFHPLKPHFSTLIDAIKFISDIDSMDFLKIIYSPCQFWKIDSRDSKNIEAAIFLGLIQADWSCSLAIEFLKVATLKDLLQSQLYFRSAVIWLGRPLQNYTFEGTLFELCAQTGDFKALEYLLKVGTGYFNPSGVLISAASATDYSDNYNRIITDLLERGADVNTILYKVTPLQIAVASSRFDIVKLLLEAGADANATGNVNGIEWKEGTYGRRLYCLHGSSPLYICRKFENHENIGFQRRGFERTSDIEIILRQYGAREFAVSSDV